LLDEKLCTCLSGPLGLCCHSVLKFLLLIFIWIIYLLVIMEFWSLSHYHLLGSICIFKSSSVYLMNLAIPMLGICKLTMLFPLDIFIIPLRDHLLGNFFPLFHPKSMSLWDVFLVNKKSLGLPF
jgi:hypothetical protein